MAPLFSNPPLPPVYVGNGERVAGGTPPRGDRPSANFIPAARQMWASSLVYACTRSDWTRLPGFTNDPNDWADEVSNPRYIVDIIGKVTRVAVTVRIVNSIASRA